MKIEQARQAARIIAQEILAGDVAVYEGAMRIWKQVIDKLDGKIPDDLWVFKSNASAIEDCKWNAEESGVRHDELIQQCEQEIIDGAKRLFQH